MDWGGVSTWVKLEGRVLLGANSTYPVGSEGGEATHKLSVNEMPAHLHGQNINGSGTDGWKNTYGAMVTLPDNKSGRAGYAANSTQNGWIVGSNRINTDNTGGNQAHNNLQPYRSAYIWRRTA